MTDHGGLLVRLRAYRPRVDRDSREDFVTEAFAWLLDESDSFSRYFVEKLSQTEDGERFTVPQDELVWETQHSLPTGGRPDMVCRSEALVLVFEHKVGAELPVSQIESYRDAAKEVFAPAEVLLVGTTRSVVEHSGEEDIALTWSMIYEWISEYLKSSQVDEVSEIYFKEFQQLLKHEGLGPAEPLATQAIRAYPVAKQLPDQLSGLLSSIQSELANVVPGYTVTFPRMRYGRLGLELVRNQDLSEWTPGIFVGCVLDGWDHGISDRLNQVVLFQIILSFDKALHAHYETLVSYQALVESLRERESENGWRVYHHIKEAGRGNLNRWHPLYLERPLLGLLEGKEESEQQSQALLDASREALAMLTANDCLNALARECDAKLST